MTLLCIETKNDGYKNAKSIGVATSALWYTEEGLTFRVSTLNPKYVRREKQVNVSYGENIHVISACEGGHGVVIAPSSPM